MTAPMMSSKAHEPLVPVYQFHIPSPHMSSSIPNSTANSFFLEAPPLPQVRGKGMLILLHFETLNGFSIEDSSTQKLVNGVIEFGGQRELKESVSPTLILQLRKQRSLVVE